MCLGDEYDERIVAEAYDTVLATEQNDCRVCPTTSTGESCAVCAAGSTPAIKAGFRELPRQDRRRLLTAVPGTQDSVRLAFRCGETRDDPETRSERCPAQNVSLPPPVCGQGYAGALCLSCRTGYHTVDERCVECVESGSSSGGVATVVTVVLGCCLLMSLCYCAVYRPAKETL